MIKFSTKLGTVSSDGITVKLSPILSKKVIWEHSLSDLTSVVYQGFGLMHNMVLEFTDGKEILETISFNKIKEVKEFFAKYGEINDVEISNKWYMDITKNVYVATYDNEKEYTKEAEKAINARWTIQNTTAGGKSFSVGKSLAGGVLFGGVGLLAGAIGKKGKIIVAYIRQV